MKKSITFLMILLCLFMELSGEPSRKKNVKYDGSKNLTIVNAELGFLTLGIPIPENHDYSWNVTLNAEGDNIFGYHNKSTLYIKKGASISSSTSVSGTLSYHVTEDTSNGYISNIGNTKNFKYYLSTAISGKNEVLSVTIIPDGDNPELKIPTQKSNTINSTDYYNQDISYSVTDNTSGVYLFKINNVNHQSDGTLGGDNTYNIVIEDLVGNKFSRTIVVDKTPPEIKIYKDSAKSFEYSDTNWTKQDLYITYNDNCSGIASINGKELYNQTGIYNLSATDKAKNTTNKTIKIDKTLPEFETSLEYKSEFDKNQNNYKSQIALNIYNISDAHSGIAKICVQPVRNGKTEAESIVYSSLEGKNNIDNQQYIYELTERNIDNNISFIVTVTDQAGNITPPLVLGGNQGYFIPASIFTGYEEITTEKNKIKVNFYKGNTLSSCKTDNYTSIKLKRNFSLTNSKDSSKYDSIIENSFGNTNAYMFNTSVMGKWKELTSATSNLNNNITTNNKESYYTDTAIENSGFTHKNISYDCIYEYTDPVNPAGKITETINNNTKLALSNNKGRYSIRVKGEEDTYLVIDDSGTIIEGSTETFKMPDTGVVELAIKIEDPDLEKYKIEIQGYVEMISENGKFKLQETDTNPVGTDGVIAGCGETILVNDNKNMFISRNKTMDGNWVKLGRYALQYNITTVFNIEITEGFEGNQEEWSSKTVKLYAQSPSVLGGKARLMVGDAGSYNADGITTRPWQKIKIEILPADENQTITDLIWDFGNGKTSENYGDYKKRNNGKFEDIYYEQSEDRMGALSEYKLKITSGTDEAEFKVNIIDTQFGTLYGDEVWRGEHIIKKEIIVPGNLKLQIGDTAHSEYDSDITCLCVGKINPENKGGITVEQGGTLILDEGDAKTIRFVQAGFKDDIYCEAAEEDKSWQNRWKGIAVKGNLSGDRLDLCDADCGLTVFPGISIELSDSIKIENCANGILMNGISLKTKEIKLNKCSGYGLKLNSILECEKILVTNCGRGIILTENGSLTVDNLEIKDSITGIHLLGGNLEIGSGRISGCSEYGIKTDKDGNYNYESVIVEDNERNIYINGLIR